MKIRIRKSTTPTPPSSPFFSGLHRFLQAKMPATGTTGQVRGMAASFSPEERQFTGFDEHLDQAGDKVNKDALLGHMASRIPQVSPVVRGESNTRQVNWTARNERPYSSYHGDGYSVYPSQSLDGDGYKLHGWRMSGPEYQDGTTYPTVEAAQGAAQEHFNKKGGVKLGTKFGDYTVPGAKTSYRERVYQWKNNPGNKFSYTAHWDEENPLFHLRTKDRQVNGKEKALHLEEVQSDWHQQGRKKGYQGDDPDPRIADLSTRLTEKESALDDLLSPVRKYAEEKYGDADLGHNILIKHAWAAGRKLDGLDGLYDAGMMPKPDHPHFSEIGDKADVILKEADDIRDQLRKVRQQNTLDIPSAPAKKSWHELAFRTALHEAAKQGKDWLTWSTGEHNAKHYNLSSQVDQISYHPESSTLKAFKNRSKVAEHAVPQGKLGDYIGEEIASKLLASPKNASGLHSLEGQELEVGGEGMKGFYGSHKPETGEVKHGILGRYADKLVKKLHGADHPGVEVVYDKYKDPSNGSASGLLKEAQAKDDWADRLEANSPDDPYTRAYSDEGRAEEIRRNREYAVVQRNQAKMAKEGVRQHFFGTRITPKMRERILSEGVPLWGDTDASVRKAIDPLDRHTQSLWPNDYPNKPMIPLVPNSVPHSPMGSAPHFHSGLHKLLSTKMKNPMPVADLEKFAKNNGIGNDEWRWSGLHGLSGKITREGALQHIETKAPSIYVNYRGSDTSGEDGTDWDFKHGIANVTGPGNAWAHDVPVKVPVYHHSGQEEDYGVAQDPDGIRHHVIQRGNDGKWSVKSTHDDPDQAEHMMREQFVDHDYRSTKWDSYSMPHVDDSEKNYQEHVLTLPRHPEEINPRNNHWGDEQNPLIHIRMSDRSGDDEYHTLHIEELQSDHHQEGRENGYKGSPATMAASQANKDALYEKMQQVKQEYAKTAEPVLSEYQEHIGNDPESEESKSWIENHLSNPHKIRRTIRDVSGSGLEDQLEPLRPLADAYGNAEDEFYKAQSEHSKLAGGTTPAPFSEDWHKLAVNHALHHAAVNGYSRLSIGPPNIQNGEWDDEPSQGMKENYGKKYPSYIDKVGRAWNTKTGDHVVHPMVYSYDHDAEQEWESDQFNDRYRDHMDSARDAHLEEKRDEWEAGGNDPDEFDEDDAMGDFDEDSAHDDLHEDISEDPDRPNFQKSELYDPGNSTHRRALHHSDKGTNAWGDKVDWENGVKGRYIDITPEMREHLKKHGVPLWGMPVPEKIRKSMVFIRRSGVRKSASLWKPNGENGMSSSIHLVEDGVKHRYTVAKHAGKTDGQGLVTYSVSLNRGDDGQHEHIGYRPDVDPARHLAMLHFAGLRNTKAFGVTKAASFYGGKWSGEGNAELDPSNGRQRTGRTWFDFGGGGRFSGKPKPGSPSRTIGDDFKSTIAKQGVVHVDSSEGRSSGGGTIPIHTFRSRDSGAGATKLAASLRDAGWSSVSEPSVQGNTSTVPGYGAYQGGRKSFDGVYAKLTAASPDGVRHTFLIQHSPSMGTSTASRPGMAPSSAPAQPSDASRPSAFREANPGWSGTMARGSRPQVDQATFSTARQQPQTPSPSAPAQPMAPGGPKPPAPQKAPLLPSISRAKKRGRARIPLPPQA